MTMPVGSFSANAFGLCDMHGNVWDWVEDCWNNGYEGAPTNGTAWTDGDCSRRVLRGGSWVNFPSGLRSASRHHGPPLARDSSIGFRLARTVSP